MSNSAADVIKGFVKRKLFPDFFLNRYIKSKRFASFSEADLINCYFYFFQSGSVMFDVGAHYGESFHSYEKLGWKIFAFEPDPRNREKIVPLSHRTELYDFAISNRDDDELVLYTSDESSGISSLTAFRESHKPSVKVRVRTLRDFSKEKAIEQVDFLKIDTEGFDLFVLQGFPFEQVQPKIIICEFEDSKTLPIGYSYRELGDFLVKNGYKVFISEWHPIVKYGIEHSWKSIRAFPTSALDDARGWGNFIAVRPDCERSFLRVVNIYTQVLGKRKG